MGIKEDTEKLVNKYRKSVYPERISKSDIEEKVMERWRRSIHRQTEYQEGIQRERKAL